MWYFKKLWLRWNEKHQEFKMNRWAEVLQAECIENTNEGLAHISNNIFTHSEVRYNIKHKKDQVLREYTDIFGDRKVLPHPIFTQNEIAQFSRNSLWERFLSFLFIILEGFIFSQLINYMIPREIRKEIWWISLPIGVILSLLLLLSIKKAIEHYFLYVDARILQKEKNLPDYKLDKFRTNRQFAIIFFLVFIGFSIFAGFIREKVLLGAAADTNPFMGKMVFLMSLTLSILVVLVLAFVEKDLLEKRTRYVVFKNWKKHEKERKNYITTLKGLYNSSATKTLVTGQVEKYWSLMKDLHAVFNCEYDFKEKDLYDEYRKMPKPDGITPEIYEKYKYIQSADKNLFEYGITKNSRVKEMAERIDAQIKEQYDEILEFEKTYKPDNHEI